MSTSVVIPVRNQPGCLRWTLASLAEQNEGVEDFEVVVVDDASTDRTAAVATSFADRVDLKLVHNATNRGRSSSRNLGAARASGDHLVFLDADSRAPADLIARHQRRHAERPQDIVIGRRIEMGWWTMNQLDRRQQVAPLPFEEDQRDSRGLGGGGIDYYARTPWLFLATHNMSMPAELFGKVGGFDETLLGWGYEDNEFAYRVFRHFDREAGHLWYDPDLVCYHMPHFRDWDREWQNTTSVLPYLKDKFRHYDIELLSHPPNHLRIAQTIPYYEQGIVYVAEQTDPTVLDEIAALVPATGGTQLWIGCGVGDRADAGPGVRAFDHSRPHTEDNYHLLGTFLPVPDGSLDAVVGVDLWRMLSPTDLSSFVMESLRVADHAYLAISRHIYDDDVHRIGLIADAEYLLDMFGSRYAIDVVAESSRVTIVRVGSLSG
uniref:Putative family 2 glycosyltransferase n=1 Tax=Amycolatopsis sp. SANK 60206 TaxID=1642649 RepID=A0A0E3USN3_9PSEU|nr:putative family 2 glycosyltransferase [Amycolatopsis sp. SANK 60206]